MFETALPDLPAQGFQFKNAQARAKASKPHNICLYLYLCMLKITEHTCADRCCGFGCMHWQQLCVEMTTGVNNAREQWPESAGLSKKCANNMKHPPCISTSLLNSCICTRRFFEIQFKTVTIIEDCYFTDTDSPRQESLIIEKLIRKNARDSIKHVKYWGASKYSIPTVTAYDVHISPQKNII